MKQKIWIVLLFCSVVIAITGCASTHTLKPHIVISGFPNIDVCLYGELVFCPRVVTKKNVEVFSFSLFIDGVLLATDTLPVRIDNYSNDFESRDYPSHSWDSTLVSQGLHTITGVAQTSSGELKVEKEIKIRRYLTNIWLERLGSNDNTVLVSIEKCDAGTTTPVSDGQVSANGENLNWDDVAKQYKGTMIPGLDPSNTMVITYRIPGESEFTESFPIEELVCNFHTTTDVNRWINGVVNNLHLKWEVKASLLHEIKLQVLCYDSEKNQLGHTANEIPEVAYNTECYLSRAVFPNETKYIKLYLTYRQLTPTSFYFGPADAWAKVRYFSMSQDTDEIKNF